MGIKHLDELPAAQIYSLLRKPCWTIYVKLDGSGIIFGVNAEGAFYTRRKTSPTVYYDVDDWPDMPWCNGFRSAHVALEHCMEHCLNRQEITPGREFHAEIIYGCQPNSIPYDSSKADHIVVTRYDQDGVNTPLFHTATVCEFAWHSDDGILLQRVRDQRWWSVISLFGESLTPRRFSRNRSLQTFLEQPSCFGVPNMQVIDCVVNRCPEFVDPTQWRDPAMKVHVKITRQRLREELRDHTQQFVHQVLTNHYKDDHEGMVVEVGGLSFKLVHRDSFGGLNDFTHRVRYYLQGGSRPPRSSFLSRTEAWPTSRRLHRLETLRQRYLAHRMRFVRYTHKGTPVRYEGELHERTLLLFAELGERILHGRTGIR